MRQAIIHIPMHKTGTSSVQQAFKGYDDGTMRYVRLDAANHSHSICAIFQNPNKKSERFSRGGYNKDVFARRDQIKVDLNRELKLDRQKFIISGEGLVHLSAREIGVFLKFLERRDIKANFVAYIREPVGFSSSSFQQQVKAEFARFQCVRPQYRERFQPFLDVAGPDAVAFADFSRDRLRNGSIVSDFAHRIGANSEGLKEHAVNESLSASMVALLFFWNREELNRSKTLQQSMARRATIRFVAEQFPGRFRFDQALVRESIDAQDVRWMEQQSGLSLMPSDLSDGGGSIGSEADLDELRQAARPPLAQMAAARGVEVPADASTSSVLTGMYQSFLMQTKS